MHTKGKAVNLSQLIEFALPSERTENHYRLIALWNAATDLTTEEAVEAITVIMAIKSKGWGMGAISHLLSDAAKLSHDEAVAFLSHGREMAQVLKMHCDRCVETAKVTGVTLICENCGAHALLAKLPSKEG
jgi:ABC-type sugar transport system ATPase subunit